MTDRMLPTFCYVLVASQESPLSEACYISTQLLRRIYPSARVTVLCDPATHSVLQNKSWSFDTVATELIELKLPENFVTAAVRSRAIKTQIRNVVEGDFVFLDCDAIPLRPFDELFNHDRSFAGVLDRNKEHTRPHMPQWVAPIYEANEWPFPVAQYFNSGVMFMRKNPLMTQLGTMWHERWCAVYRTFGKHQDQPSLNATLNELAIDTLTLPINYNAMVDSSIAFARNAKIVHYFFNGRQSSFDPESLLQAMIEELRANDRVELEHYDNHIANSDPWIHPTNSIRKELVCGHYANAARLCWRRLSNSNEGPRA